MEGGKETMKKLILPILAIISLASGIYAAYGIFNSYIEPLVGAFLVVASLLVVIWYHWLEKKSPLNDKTILSILLPVLLITCVTLFYAGVTPFASGEQQLLSKLQIPGETTINPITQKESSVVESIKKIIPASDIASLKSISVGGYILNGLTATGINAYLIPSKSVLADKVYKADLYEKGKFRDTTTVIWNQPEINIQKVKKVSYPLTKIEINAYILEDISHLFTVKVHE